MTSTLAEPEAIESVDSEAPGPLEVDLSCVGCGYNLRGATRSGVCPECGLAVAKSDRPDRLAYADVEWLKLLARAIDRVLLALVIGAVSAVALAAADGASRLVSYSPLIEIVTWAFAMPAGLLLAGACWRLTTPEPRCKGGAFSEWNRRLARTCIIVLVALAIATAPLFVLLEQAAHFTIGCGYIAAVIGGFAALMYANTLATRIPQPRLARHTRGVLILYAFLVAITIGGVGVAVLFQGVSQDVLFDSGIGIAVFVVFSLLVLLGVIGSGIAAVWTLALFIAYRFAFLAVVTKRS